MSIEEIKDALKALSEDERKALLDGFGEADTAEEVAEAVEEVTEEAKTEEAAEAAEETVEEAAEEAHEEEQEEKHDAAEEWQKAADAKFEKLFAELEALKNAKSRESNPVSKDTEKELDEFDRIYNN